MTDMREKHAAQHYTLVARWLNSGERKLDFCSKHEININTFNYWISKYRKSNRFIELKPPKAGAYESEMVVRFSFSGGVSAEVPAEIALQFMHELSTK